MRERREVLEGHRRTLDESGEAQLSLLNSVGAPLAHIEVADIRKWRITDWGRAPEDGAEVNGPLGQLYGALHEPIRFHGDEQSPMITLQRPARTGRPRESDTNNHGLEPPYSNTGFR